MRIQYGSLLPYLVSGFSFCVPVLKWTHFEAGLCFGKVCQRFSVQDGIMTIFALFVVTWNDKMSEHQTGNQELQVVFLTTSLTFEKRH